MVRIKWISEKINQTKTIIALASSVGGGAYFYSKDLVIGILASIITLIALVVVDLDDRVKYLEKKSKKGTINYKIILIFIIILIIFLILASA